MSYAERERPRKAPRYCRVAADSVERIRLVVNYQSRVAKSISMAINRFHQSAQFSCLPALANNVAASPPRKVDIRLAGMVERGYFFLTDTAIEYM